MKTDPHRYNPPNDCQHSPASAQPAPECVAPPKTSSESDPRSSAPKCSPVMPLFAPVQPTIETSRPSWAQSGTPARRDRASPRAAPSGGRSRSRHRKTPIQFSYRALLPFVVHFRAVAALNLPISARYTTLGTRVDDASLMWSASGSPTIRPSGTHLWIGAVAPVGVPKNRSEDHLEVANDPRS
jgi:hypothetical protein